MSKFIKKLFTPIVTFALSIGVGISLSRTETPVKVEAASHSVTVTRSSFAVSSAAYGNNDAWTATGTDGTVLNGEFDIFSNAGQTNMQTRSNKTYGDHFHNISPFPGPITEIEMVYDSGTARPWTPYVSTSTVLKKSNIGDNGTSLGQKTVSATTTWTVNASNAYRYVYLQLGGSGAAYLKSITITYEVGGGVVIPDLTDLDISGELSRNKFYVGQSFTHDGLIATATYDDDSTSDVTSAATWTANPSTATSTSITSVTFTASYEENGITKNASVIKNVTVADGIIYDLETNNSSWFTWDTAYSSHTVTHTDVGQSMAATMQFYFASKQNSGVGSTYPCIATKIASEAKALTFTLNQPGKVIESVELDLVNRGSPELWLHKGDSIDADTVLDHVKIEASDTELTLSTDNLNDTVFTLGYKGIASSNKQVGLRSIIITVADVETFGTLDHIKVTSLPNKTVYATGERFSSEGLVVTAYDDADESKANFKVVTEEVEMLTDDTYYFQFSDMPGYDSEIYYTEDGITVETSFYIEVVLGARYRRVEKDHSQWDGTYLIVVEKAEGEHIAFNPSGDLVDSVGNYVDVEVDGWNNIDAPSYLELQIETIEGGYSLKIANGQYIGHNNNSNGLSTSTSQTTFVNSITFDEESLGVVIGNNKEPTRSLTYNTSADRFRYYSDDNVVQLYERVASQGADDWGEMFLGLLDCDPDGLTPPSVKDWNDLAEMYLDTENGDLGDEDWYIYRTALPNPSPDAQVAEQVAARYDYILAKYGTDTYQNFMNREVPEFAANPLTNQMILKQQQTTTVIVTFATLALVTIGGYGYIRLAKKRKDN